jgi:hypothetical protein
MEQEQEKQPQNGRHEVPLGAGVVAQHLSDHETGEGNRRTGEQDACEQQLIAKEIDQSHQQAEHREQAQPPGDEPGRPP